MNIQGLKIVTGHNAPVTAAVVIVIAREAAVSILLEDIRTNMRIQCCCIIILKI
jgi:hypothetical protein